MRQDAVLRLEKAPARQPEEHHHIRDICNEPLLSFIGDDYLNLLHIPLEHGSEMKVMYRCDQINTMQELIRSNDGSGEALRVPGAWAGMMDDRIRHRGSDRPGLARKELTSRFKEIGFNKGLPSVIHRRQAFVVGFD